MRSTDRIRPRGPPGHHRPAVRRRYRSMRPYEVMVIFDADLEEETIRSAVERSIALIESKGAERGPVDWRGKRRLAYEVKHRWEGYYVVLQAKAEPVAMDELYRWLPLAHSGIPHKMRRSPEHVYGQLGGTPETNSAT